MSNDMAEARRGRAQKIAERRQTLAERVQEIIADPNIDAELKRKLAYCQQEINKGRDDGLSNTRTALLREVARRRPSC